MDLIFLLDNWTLLIRCWQSCFMNVVVLEYWGVHEQMLHQSLNDIGMHEVEYLWHWERVLANQRQAEVDIQLICHLQVKGTSTNDRL